MSKQGQIDQLGERVWKLEEALNGGDFPATPGLRNAVLAQHDQLVSLRDEVASLRRRVKDLENMTGKQAKAETQAEPNGEAPSPPVGKVSAEIFEDVKADRDAAREAATHLICERDEWKARAEKAEAEAADLQAQIRVVKRVLGVPMPAENSYHGKAA